jgi:hypothetical protein
MATSAASHVIVCDYNRARRRLVARMFRTAGCVVLETGRASEVQRGLEGRDHSWILAVVDRALPAAFCDSLLGVPVLRLGGGHQASISGRLSCEGSPDLGMHLHALAGAHEST